MEAHSSSDDNMPTVFHFTKKTVTLKADVLEWGQKQKEIVLLNEVIAVHPGNRKTASTTGLVTVHYIKPKSGHKLRCSSETFVGETTVCEAFIQEVKQRQSSVSAHPRRLLIFINPISGDSHAQYLYETKAAPIFSLAGIDTDIIVTERANHSRDILLTYNLSQIDGVVAVGGDGIYYECLNGLVSRAQREAGIDEDDPLSKLKPAGIPLGIIPAGTGNGVVKSCVGCLDVETSVFAIVLGHRRKYNIMTLFSDGKLLVYSGLLVAHGIFSDMICYTETHRKYGRSRYLRSLAKVIWKNNPRIIDMEISYLPDSVVQDSENGGNGLTETSDWCTVHGNYTNIVQFGYNIPLELAGQLETFTSSLPLMIQKFCTRTQALRLVYRIAKQKRIDVDFLKILNVKAFKVRFSNEDDSPSEGASSVVSGNELTRTLDVDGEIVLFNGLDFEVRSHLGLIELYSSLPS